jgi:hypothetical protein
MKATDRGEDPGDILHLTADAAHWPPGVLQDDQGVHGADLALGVDQRGLISIR